MSVAKRVFAERRKLLQKGRSFYVGEPGKKVKPSIRSYDGYSRRLWLAGCVLAKLNVELVRGNNECDSHIMELLK